MADTPPATIHAPPDMTVTPRKTTRPPNQHAPATNRSLIWLGVVTTLSNPFWFGWWVGVAGSYVLGALQFGWLALSILFVSHIAVDYLWDSFLAGVVGSGRRWINNTVYRGLLVVAGLFLLYVGIQFLLRAAAAFGLPLGSG